MSEPGTRRRVTGGDAWLALLLVGMFAMSFQLISMLRQQQQLATDLAELNSVRYGMLNADAWVVRVSVIVERKVSQFELTADNRAAVKRSLERMLDTLITEADLYLRRPAVQATALQRAKTRARDALVDMNQVKAGIPRYADRILEELNKPGTRRDISGFLTNLLEDASHSTFTPLDKSALRAIEDRYRCDDRMTCRSAIQNRIKSQHPWAVAQALAVITLACLIFGNVVLRKAPRPAQLGLLLMCSVALMACGVLTPMIQVEARISEFGFVLLGDPVTFTDQVLYFQSKSVLDVVQILIATRKPDMLLVGLLIVLFAVFFPLAKLMASFVYLYGGRAWRNGRVTRFFALKSGKWSMADVFVVSIFMAYIGFNGIIASQLSTFGAAADAGVNVITTNNTSLQIGFFMFLAFCIASLFASLLIERAAHAGDEPDTVRIRERVS